MKLLQDYEDVGTLPQTIKKKTTPQNKDLINSSQDEFWTATKHKQMCPSYLVMMMQIKTMRYRYTPNRLAWIWFWKSSNNKMWSKASTYIAGERVKSLWKSILAISVKDIPTNYSVTSPRYMS